MTDWLIDKSALTWVGSSPDAAVWIDRIQRGLVSIATPTLLEIGYSARSAADWMDRVQAPPVSLMPVASLSPRAERRALEVQEALTRRGHHRAPSVSDLLLAGVAEAENLTLLHVDKDFDLIADVTGQPVERLQLG